MFFNAVFNVYMLSCYDRYARLINLTLQSIVGAVQSIDNQHMVTLILKKHYNLESEIQNLLPTHSVVLDCKALS